MVLGADSVEFNDGEAAPGSDCMGVAVWFST